MKSAALKFLAFGGVALAAYPIVASFQPDRTATPQLPEVIRPGSSNKTVPTPGQNQLETALSLSVPTQASSGPGNMVLIKPDQSGHFITRASINGVAIPLMFDTGASIVALSFEDALKIGIRLTSNDFRSQIQTANGLAPAAELTLKEIRIDGISIPDVPAMVLPPGKLETSLMGRSFWGRLKTGFSYASGNLILKN